MDQLAILDSATVPTRPAFWSLDAWAICRPKRAFQFIAAQPAGGGLWLAIRRPLFVTFALGCGISLLTTGVLTLRVLLSVTTYWTFVPAIEAVALVAVVRRRPGGATWAATIDRFFVGHGTWTLFLILLVGSLAFTPPHVGWRLILTTWLPMLGVVIGWSAYVDFCFFRWISGASSGGAVARVLVHRVLVWIAVFVVFAVPDASPAAFAAELREIFEELARP